MLHKHSVVRGGVHLVLALAFTTGLGIFSHLSHPFTSIWIMLFVQSIIGVALSAPGMKKEEFHINGWGLMLFRSVIGISGCGLVYLAVNKTSLVNTMLLYNTAPIFLPFISWLWIRRYIHPSIWWGIFIGFAGVLLILKPTGGDLGKLGIIYGLLSGLFYALIQVALRLLGKKNRERSLVFYFFLFSAFFTFPFAFIYYKPICKICWVWLMAMSFCSYLAQICYVKAFKYARPIEINPLNYTGVIFSSIAGWILWNQRIDWIGGVGIALIIGGSLLTFYLDTD